MTALPPSADFIGSSITEGQFKTALASQRTFLSELLGADSADKVAAQAALGAILCDSLDKAGTYTVVAADKGKVINCNGTFSLNLAAAATLGDGFQFAVWNNGAGVITIDPNASEPIDGATIKTLAAGKLAIVYCDGLKFVTVGSIATGPGSGLNADLLDGQHGSYYAPAVGANYAPITGGNYVAKDNGFNAIGSYALGTATSTASTVEIGQIIGSEFILSGSWRCVGSTSTVFLWQRIA